MQRYTDEEAMALAIEVAQLGLGWVEPNPPVGCVILDRNRQLLATGYHHRFGKEHAEIDALKSIKDPKLLKGAHIFVTLEPCSHYGKTPPCANALAELPIASVIYGRKDPNSLVEGRGLKLLKKSGIRVTPYKGQRSKFELQTLADAFHYSHSKKRSFVTLKVASSLDGQIALSNGESQWITGEPARRYSHFLRATHGAVLVGRKTLLHDNPKLDIRLPGLKKFRKNNTVVVLDPSGKFLKKINSLNISKVRSPESIIVVTGPKVKTLDRHCRHIKISLHNRKINLSVLRRQLFKMGIQSLLVEGGGDTISEFIKQGQANKLALFLAPSLIGAKTGISWTKSLGISSLKRKFLLQEISIDKIVNDFLITGYFKGGLV